MNSPAMEIGSRPRLTTVSLANGYNGYLPREPDHAHGGYETWRARSSYLEATAEAKIVAALERMLAAVAARHEAGVAAQ